MKMVFVRVFFNTSQHGQIKPMLKNKYVTWKHYFKYLCYHTFIALYYLSQLKRRTIGEERYERIFDKFYNLEFPLRTEVIEHCANAISKIKKKKVKPKDAIKEMTTIKF
ncbi:hypothetical protein M0R19_05150 [Candidatus Pacearchaeota archaeon]|jgi:uncharacterized protein YdcH (DUF465 family)|nr:hypothetical protein [Candidatus Pacearchaeota archaeon]